MATERVPFWAVRVMVEPSRTVGWREMWISPLPPCAKAGVTRMRAATVEAIWLAVSARLAVRAEAAVASRDGTEAGGRGLASGEVTARGVAWREGSWRSEAEEAVARRGVEGESEEAAGGVRFS